MKLLKSVAVTLIVSILSAAFCFNASALVIYDGGFGFEINASKHTATLVGYSGDSETVNIPDYFHGYPVTVIDRNAFSGNKTIREVVFSNTNTTVEEYAFMNCDSLETVYIPENVVSFGDRVFADCTGLKTVAMLSDITAMPDNIFSGCVSLENLTVSESIKEFGYGCFNGCSSLTNLDFAANGVMLQSYAFNGTGAESVVLSDSLIAIPDYAFTNCLSLRSVTIPESVILIQPNAFDWENITIRCYEGSYAHNFAAENNIPYELIEDVMLGDVNGDNRVNINDVTAIQRYIARIESLDASSLFAADTDQDGNIIITDATTIQIFIAGRSVPYPIGEFVRK
ncbi:MAG: leucine-rich repeat protein [Ruminococcus sp.]|nr:leucine-rich repeat protein [Ruminococcus sp.]